ncbi:hypothetical protein PoB_001240100 [Plakobranchus ocellatus]|uniref:Uncharacterized protein n=1 Tax=Plakobranchus ocellatus TaxID=259542 RepID=A0AAV3YF10_9GAST|nr:hypothetical protein PoB_001240100 [Plakobranchus ocellatus]
MHKIRTHATRPQGFLGWFLLIASPQQDDLRLSGPPSGQGTGGRARIRYRRVPADLRAVSLATVPPTTGYVKPTLWQSAYPSAQQ